jgi:hypothetical protein
MTILLLLPGRNGSGYIATGFMYTSLFCPDACPVDEPSKFQIGRSEHERFIGVQRCTNGAGGDICKF